MVEYSHGKGEAMGSNPIGGSILEDKKHLNKILFRCFYIYKSFFFSV